MLSEYSVFLNFSNYPEKIYPKFLKILLYGIIPSAYIAFVPINIVENFNIIVLIMFILAIVIFPTISVIVFNKSVKHYESGNNTLLRE